MNSGRPISASAIRAFIFDLDGTLADTEVLKARTYEHLVQQLLNAPAPDPRVLELYPTLIGGTDEQMVRALVDRFGLSAPLAPYLEKYQVGEPWLALHHLRFDVYRAKFATAERLRAHSYTGTVEMARAQHAAGRTVAVATSSPTDEARRVLDALGLSDVVTEVVGLDQVKRHKPHPEIYLLTAKKIGVQPSEAIAIEDSPTGIRAALSAGMACVAISNQFTDGKLRAQAFLSQEWIVYDRQRLNEVVERRIATLAADA
ncbi:MAG: HAD family phosphatase [Chloroflexi bacterium]|nr:HAD family phosphatase [Chloroflexota bacterium]